MWPLLGLTYDSYFQVECGRFSLMNLIVYSIVSGSSVENIDVYMHQILDGDRLRLS